MQADCPWGFPDPVVVWRLGALISLNAGLKKQNKIKWVINERQFLSKILLEIYGKPGLSSFKSPILDFVEVI